MPGPETDEPTPPAEPTFPWARLARAAGAAADPKKLALAVAGLVLLHAGWAVLDGAFPRSAALTPEFRGTPLRDPRLGPPAEFVTPALRAVIEPYVAVLAPFLGLFDAGATLGSFAHAGLAAIWAAAAWGVFGGAIARIAVVEAAGGGRVGLTSAMRFALRRAVPLVAAPLCPLLAIALMAALVAPLGLLYRIPGQVGATVAGVLLIFPLGIGLVLALVGLILAAAWPLMHATVAAEGSDVFDAISRSFSYVNQRLPRYLVLVVLACAVGAVGQLAVDAVARAAVYLARWSLAILGPDARLAPLFSPGTGVEAGSLAAAIHAAWLTLVDLIVHAWAYSYFWTVAATIYLMLRRDVDGTPRHAVYLEAHDADAFADEPSPAAVAPVAEDAAPPGDRAVGAVPISADIAAVSASGFPRDSAKGDRPALPRPRLAEFPLGRLDVGTWRAKNSVNNADRCRRRCSA